MYLYKVSGSSLSLVQNEKFALEKDIQSLVEANLETVFGLEFICSEFTVGAFRIDTLCFDEQTNSFVIVEYKKGSSYSVIDQGYSYLSVMLNNKAEFILEYNEQCENALKKSDVDWSSTRVIFVSPAFNAYQRNSVNFKDVPFELWEIRRFENGYVALEQLHATSTESIESISGKNNSNVISEVSKVVKVAKEDDHLKKSSKETLEIWNELRNKFAGLPDVHFSATKDYVGIKRDNTLICAVRFRKNALNFNINRGTISVDGTKSKDFFNLKDPQNLAQEKSWNYKSGQSGHEYVIKASNTDDIEDVNYLLKQKYESLG